MKRPTVLSGIMASGELHIGNYIGALSVWADGQDQFENYLFIADLHAFTMPEAVTPASFLGRVRRLTAVYLACGLDPERSVIFRQSSIAAHSELAWLLDCVTPISWLERGTQYKSKAVAGGGDSAGASAGLLTYPVLQAADILLYQADYVPVGDDQRQHVEMTRDIAQRFNRLFGDVLKPPDLLVRTSGARVMGLDDPTVKMSKSVAETKSGHAIGLLDAPDVVRRTVMRAVTDSSPSIDFEHLSPGAENLLVLLEVLGGVEREETRRRFDGSSYKGLKEAVVEVVNQRLAVIQARYREITADPATIDGVLRSGAERAAVVAAETLGAVHRAMGLR